MYSNFDEALSHVLKHEGGFVNHPADPGGATNKGVTLANFRRYVKPNGTVDDLKRLTTAQAGVVYKRFYWDAVLGDDLPSGVDYAVFDFAVNSGPKRAAEYLQRVLGVPADGRIGPKTLDAADAADPVAVIDNLCDERLAYMKRIKGGKLWQTFGRGWQRRVDGVRSGAVAMARRQPPAPVSFVPPEAEELIDDSDKGFLESNTDKANMIASAGGLSGIGGLFAYVQDWRVQIALIFALLLVAGAALYIFASRRRKAKLARKARVA